MQSFQAWLQGSGLKPKAHKAPPALEFPEPIQNQQQENEEPLPPAGNISNVSFAQAQVDMLLSWGRGEIFRVVFLDVLVFRDNRGLEGAAFYDALDLEESQMMNTVLKSLPVSLDSGRDVFHYQFLNRLDRPIIEVLSRQPADYQLIQGVPE